MILLGDASNGCVYDTDREMIDCPVPPAVDVFATTPLPWKWPIIALGAAGVASTIGVIWFILSRHRGRAR